MVKKRRHEKRNLYSLVFGIVLIMAGLFSFAALLPAAESIIIVPIVVLIFGAFFTLLGGFGAW